MRITDLRQKRFTLAPIPELTLTLLSGELKFTGTAHRMRIHV
jgi:hypothetical protein